MEKSKELLNAQEKYIIDCKQLDVSANLNDFVFGIGNIDAIVMLVGEAPGAYEAKEGIPFVGKAGKQLDELLEGIGLGRDDIYITNAVKYRPITKGKNSNRAPSKKEVLFSMPLLEMEIAEVNPKIIVSLGNIPLFAICGEAGIMIGDVHAKCLELDGRTLFPLYHPASAIYNPKLKDVMLDDMAELAKLIAKLGR